MCARAAYAVDVSIKPTMWCQRRVFLEGTRLSPRGGFALDKFIYIRRVYGLVPGYFHLRHVSGVVPGYFVCEHAYFSCDLSKQGTPKAVPQPVIKQRLKWFDRETCLRHRRLPDAVQTVWNLTPTNMTEVTNAA